MANAIDKALLAVRQAERELHQAEQELSAVAKAAVAASSAVLRELSRPGAIEAQQAGGEYLVTDLDRARMYAQQVLDAGRAAQAKYDIKAQRCLQAEEDLAALAW